MTKVYCFVTGYDEYEEIGVVNTACALTDKGKWIAGAVSKNYRMAVNRVADMAIQKIDNGILTGPYEIIRYDNQEDETIPTQIRDAMKLAFERMP